MTSTHTEVQMFIAVRDFSSDVVSKGDPFALLMDLTAGGKTPIGRTEVVKTCASPQFKTAISVNYFFEIRQNMRVEFLAKEKNDVLIGYCEFTMGTLMSAKNSALELPIVSSRGANAPSLGTALITAAAIGHNKGFFALQLSGQNLKNKAMCSTISPKMVISRQVSASQTKVVYTSEAAKATVNPQWALTKQINLVDLCGADMLSKSIRLECFHGSKSLGGVIVSAEDIMKRSAEFLLVDLKAATKSNTAKNKGTNEKKPNLGSICVNQCNFTRSYDFLEYLHSGMEINIAFSIDFTGSNGPPSDPRSLHYYNPSRPNNYIRAMLAVSNVVQEYDSDRMFPAYGFGAIAPFTNGTSHFFPLSGNPANAYLSGMQSVVDTYAAILPALRFSGPTNFAPTIITITEGARQAKGVYTILMILTDGAITDMQDTIDAIVAADDAPLSIVIIGIGSADFSSMVRLDGDAEPLVNRRGVVTRRDLVQFVPFNEFEGKKPELLAAAVLQEIPLQVEVWGRISGTTPEHFGAPHA